MASAFYELKKAKNGEYHFVLKAANGEAVLSSETYKSRKSAENGIASVQKNCAEEARFAPVEAKNGQFFFTLKAGNNEVIGKSEMYSSAASRDAGIQAVKKNGATSVVKDITG